MAQRTRFSKPILPHVDVICDWNQGCLHTGKLKALYMDGSAHTPVEWGVSGAERNDTLVPGSPSLFSSRANRSLGSTEDASECLEGWGSASPCLC